MARLNHRSLAQFLRACSCFMVAGALAGIVGCANRFDSAGWKAHRGVLSESSVRQRMVKDLLDRHQLTGMGYVELAALLGKADLEMNEKNGIVDHCYRLGQSPKDPFDSEWLIVTVRKGGESRVLSARIASF